MLLSLTRPRRWPLAVALAALVGVALSFFVLSNGASSASAAGGTFRNPVGTGPDPFMTYYNGSYYLTMTEGSSIKVHRAASIDGLLTSPATTVWTDTDASRNKDIWAPEFYRINSKWYMYYTADDGTDANHRIYVLESDTDNPAGTYHFKAKLVPPNHDSYSIDPTVLQVNGKLYLLYAGINQWQHNGTNIVALSNPYTVSGNSVPINTAGDCADIREAPETVHGNGKTWMTYSVCDTGTPDYKLYEMSLADGADPMVAANWVQHSGAVFSRNDAAGVFGPGHNAFFKSPDGTEDWIVYGAKDTSAVTYTNRTSRAQKITWNSDGSPNLGAPLAIGATENLPSGDPGPATGWINDTNTSSGVGSVAYTGTWNAGTACGVQCFWGDDHSGNQTGATATFTFTGTQLALLSVMDTGNGKAAISVDGGAEKTVDYYPSSGLRSGEDLMFTTAKLAKGTHTVKVRVTGTKNAASSGTYISIDRAEVWS